MRFILILVLILLPVLTFAQREHHIKESKLKQELYKEWQTGPESLVSQDEYDVKYYTINLDLDPLNKMLCGNVTVRAQVTAASLNDLALDFSSNMSVDSVFTTEGRTAFTHENNELTIHYTAAATIGQTISAEIFYHGNPASTGLGSFQFAEYNEKPMIWSLSEPYGAREWWPCKDMPVDKADSVDINITLPEGMIAASNGTLKEQVTKDGKTTFFWQERYPIATYLVSIACYEYHFYTDTYVSLDGKNVPIEFYVFPDHAEFADLLYNYAKTNNMMECFAVIFGEYPFVKEKYGHAEFLWGGGMEHQTCTSLGGWSEGLISHELAHMWWGDMITCRDFHHIWLNEGFATYSEALWREYNGGMHAYHQEMSYNAYKGGGTIYVSDDTNTGKIFHAGLSYAKGSYVLHMLRHITGDEDFFEIIRTYYSSRHQYETAVTQDFQDICEEVSGMDLNYFFRQWIYGQYFPDYEYIWNYEYSSSKYLLHLNLFQTQITGLFKMPLDIHISAAAYNTVITITDSLDFQEFVFELDSEPQSLAIDPENWVLKKTEELIKPDFDKGILLVNGVDWSVAYTELAASYNAQAFSGIFSIDFFDVYDAPVQGYPAILPGPLGHGEVTLELLKQYSAVIWAGGNNFDWIRFYHANVMEYLKLGGNLILITPNGKKYLETPDKLAYLGIEFLSVQKNGLSGFNAAGAQLNDMDTLSAMQNVWVFSDTLAGSESEIIFKDKNDSSGFALGVWHKPLNGTVFNEYGGQFVYIAAEPQKLEHQALSNNISFFLENAFKETPAGLSNGGPKESLVQDFEISSVYPNPFNASVTISLRTLKAVKMDISIYNTLGQTVAELAEQKQFEAGSHQMHWNASDQASGLYLIHMETSAKSETRKALLIK